MPANSPPEFERGRSEGVCFGAAARATGPSGRNRNRRRTVMAKKFKVGDHVTWNSEAGQVSGKITKVHTEDVDFKGHLHHASEDDPQYEIKSDKTDHVAMHKGAALKKVKPK
jgi:hypothetical protein